MSIDTKYTRRALLNRIGGGAACAALTSFIPFTEAEAAMSTQPRYWYMYHPVSPPGNIKKASLPSSTAEVSDLVFRDNLTALNARRSQISLYRGLFDQAGNSGDAGGGHGNEGASILSGFPVLQNRVGSGTPVRTNGGNFGLNEKSSVDQFIADELAKTLKMPIKDIRYGWTDSQVDEIVGCSYRNGVRMGYDGNVSRLFDRIFPLSNTSGTGGGQDQSHRKDILNAVFGDVQRVQRSLSAIDKQRLERHLEAIDEVNRMIPDTMDDGQIMACNLPGTLDGVTGKDASVDAFAKLIAIAFNCDLTRVVGSIFSGYNFYKDTDRFNLRSLSNTAGGTYHGLTHGNSGERGYDVVRAALKYRADTFLRAMAELESFENGTGGTLLDDTILHWFCESNYDHTNNDSFNVIAGGAGYFRMGKQFICGGTTGRNTNFPQNMLLTSIANAMGINIGDYGAYSKGPLPSRYLV